MTAQLEHANFTVSDPAATAHWMEELFGWRIRWQGDAISGGHTIHVGTDSQYLALYTPPKPPQAKTDSYAQLAGLNHIAVTVEDLEKAEAKVKTLGFVTKNHADYEPGRRFYFHDNDGIEYEVVQYD
ncbi:catechol 2,3-dioxygenase-like lactoylglutathione lyase family enzyme [Sulfitobacter undariae]|uniref:Catechol 2,3-dioxygenase-like lactoylglutathione lyase family enzyme n=1 Tax=Sulfitobacter undariae TaxID=1563671 RepID=A0A7W6E1Y3_9RHOB|nr:VOC family protein [Sulfitobacter undariae]MBB3993218.1 catechol 2,3-dioxygenase-like lactoylglutathione lyase family enzyme [Sulfitobacter undariae]